MFTLNRSQPSSAATYTPADLQGEWEFKNLQSSSLAFHKPEVMQKVREEEQQAGWILLEKINDGHLRFKRPVSARSNDHNLSFDVYRSQYGTSMLAVQLVILAIVFTTAVAIFLYLSSRINV